MIKEQLARKTIKVHHFWNFGIIIHSIIVAENDEILHISCSFPVFCESEVTSSVHALWEKSLIIFFEKSKEALTQRKPAFKEI